MKTFQEHKGKAFHTRLIDWAIEGMVASNNKKLEAAALIIIGKEYQEKGDRASFNIAAHKNAKALHYASQFNGEAYAYLLIARMYAHEHNVTNFQTQTG